MNTYITHNICHRLFSVLVCSFVLFKDIFFIFRKQKTNKRHTTKQIFVLNNKWLSINMWLIRWFAFYVMFDFWWANAAENDIFNIFGFCANANRIKVRSSFSKLTYKIMSISVHIAEGIKLIKSSILILYIIIMKWNCFETYILYENLQK